MRKVLRWEDPPHSRNVGNQGGRPPDSSWNPVAEELRDSPKRWGVLYEGDSRPTAMSIRSKVVEGRTSCFRPRGDFEARVRSWAGRWTVYARYLGEGWE